jgi:hypothetical protein
MQQRSDLAGGAGWMAFGVVIVVASWRMERFEQMGATLYTAPGLVPGLFGLLLMLLGALLALRGWRARRPAVAAPAPLLSTRIGWTLLLTLAYAALAVGRAPFALATAVFVAAFCWLFSESPSAPRRIGVAIAAGVLTALFVVVVFERLFLVRLP